MQFRLRVAEAIGLIRKQIGKSQTHVFCFQGKLVTQGSTKPWHKAEFVVYVATRITPPDTASDLLKSPLDVPAGRSDGGETR
jgi:hypothetical protein